LKINAVATSNATAQMAAELGIPVLDSVVSLDISIDGADEIDPAGNLIKGGGGALTREKIVASASRYRVYVCDKSKLVKKLGNFPLPVEILPFGKKVTIARVTALGCTASLRRAGNSLLQTDNGNYVLDCHFGEIGEPAKLSAELNNIPGVLDNGLFCGLTNLVIVGNTDGSIERIQF
jgi:ribose 5-phosphate isomerase A